MKQLSIEAAVQNIEPVTQFVDAELNVHGCSERARLQIDMAIDEIFGNIAQYAYAGEKGSVTVQIDVKDGAAVITFLDEGICFNPLLAEEPDVSLDAAERSIGGLGIFLVKKTMDSLAYERRSGKNVLTLTKHI